MLLEKRGSGGWAGNPEQLSSTSESCTPINNTENVKEIYFHAILHTYRTLRFLWCHRRQGDVTRGVTVCIQGENLYKSDVGLEVVDTCVQVICVSLVSC